MEISASCAGENEANAAMDAAFNAVEAVQNLMSAHDPASELSRLNRDAASFPLSVSHDTYEVLRRAHELAEESRGAFDYTVAPTLARWKFLPPMLERASPGNWRDVHLLRGRRVYFRRSLALDLGGIAKGFAVDKAIETLRQRGVTSAVVNAGGDLRVLGPKPSTVHVRHPAHPQDMIRAIHLQEAALATSSPCFTERRWRGRRVSHLVDPLRHNAVTGIVSVSVRARECWLADGLTKVVLNAPDLARELLTKYDAQALLLRA